MSFNSPVQSTSLGVIENDGFWADLDGDLFLKQYHVSQNFDSELLQDGLVLAIIDINKKLQPVKTVLLVDYSDLAAYVLANPNTVGGVEIVIKKYQEAVFSYAKSGFLETAKSDNRREEAKSVAAEMPETKEYWLNKSANAVNFLFALLAPDESTTTGMRARLITPTYYA